MRTVPPCALAPAPERAQPAVVPARGPQVQRVAAGQLEALRAPAGPPRADLVDHVPPEMGRDRLDLLVAGAPVELRRAPYVPARRGQPGGRAVLSHVAQARTGYAEPRVRAHLRDHPLEVPWVELEVGVELGEQVPRLVELRDAPCERPQLRGARP